jgi:hypothetical protein
MSASVALLHIEMGSIAVARATAATPNHTRRLLKKIVAIHISSFLGSMLIKPEAEYLKQLLTAFQWESMVKRGKRGLIIRCRKQWGFDASKPYWSYRQVRDL